MITTDLVLLGVVVGGVRWIGKDLGEVATGYLPVLADRLKKEGEAVVFLTVAGDLATVKEKGEAWAVVRLVVVAEEDEVWA